MKFLLNKLSEKTIAFWGLVAAIITLIITIGIWLWPDPYNLFNSAPLTFEINVLNFPNKGENVYYVTDALIRTQGDFSAYHDFILSPLSVEVVPHYSGNTKYGNLVLRVSGGGSTKDYKLWADFDKSSQTQTVTIEMGDILSISGIRQNKDETETNLMLGKKPFQEAELQFKVVRLSDPEKPISPVVKLPVLNTPWKQEVKVIQRNGWVIDYALTNYGGEATFHCIVNIASALQDINEDDNSFWSGTKLFNYGPNCQPFTLKKGETYQVSFRLDTDTLGKDLLHGRYFVQVYTIMERNDIVFNPPSNYENYDELWLVANEANVETLVICNDPGKTCAQTFAFPLEQANVQIYPFSSQSELGNGETRFIINAYPVDDRVINQYIFEYSLDPNKDGWVGLGAWFNNTFDLSAYAGIRFKLVLDQSLHPIWVEVSSQVNGESRIVRVEVGNGQYGNAKIEEQMITIPFSAFQNVDWTKVDSIKFIVDNFMVPDANTHVIRISEIEFIQ